MAPRGWRRASTRFLAAIALAGPRRGRGTGADLSQPTAAHRRAVRGRRGRARHHGPPGRPASRRRARTAGGDRQPAGRGRHRRRRGRGPGRARRLHAPDGQHRAAGEPLSLRQALLRSAHRLRAGDDGQCRAAAAGRQSVGAGAIGGGADRLRQGASGPAQLRLGRRRQHALPRHRTPEVDDGHRRGACALQGRRAGAGRSHGRAAHLHDRERAGHVAAGEVGQAARARDHQRPALAARARPADDGRGRRGGLRNGGMERRLRRQGHATRNRRAAQRNPRECPRLAGCEGAVGDAGRGARRRHAASLRRVRQRRIGRAGAASSRRKASAPSRARGGRQSN